MALSAMAGIQGLLAGLLDDAPPRSAQGSGMGAAVAVSREEVADALFSALEEKFAEDAKPRREPTLEEHDRRHHPGGFDPETETCTFRDKLKMKDAVDLIYATSDIHQCGIEDITDTECGTIVVAGDFMEKAKRHSDFKNAEKWWDEHFLPWCESHKGQQIVIIGGNCDKWLYENRDKVEWPSNVHYLDDTASEVNGMKVYGTSWCPHNMDGAWEVDDERLEEEFAKIPEGLDVLVTHVPPKGEGLDLDRDNKNGGNFGSEALTKAILEKKPKIVLCGHIHRGSHKPVKIGDSIVMNVSRVEDDRFEQTFHGRRIGIDRTDNGLGFLVDMDYSGRVEMPEKGDVPSDFIRLRDALKDAARSINHHIDVGDYKPNKVKLEAAKKALSETEKKVEEASGLDGQKKMLLSAAASFKASEKSGFKKPVRRIGKLYKGDGEGSANGFGFSAKHGGGWNFAEFVKAAKQKEAAKQNEEKSAKKPGHSLFVDMYGRYKSPWQYLQDKAKAEEGAAE